jgi:CPA2 family monovalent cation:H+ antiporter-2
LPNYIPQWLVEGVELVGLLILCSPFLYAIIHAGGRSEESRQLWHSTHTQQAKLIAVSLLRIFVSINIVAYAIYRFFTFTYGIVFAVALVVVLLVMLSRRVRRQSHALNHRFSNNLSARETAAERRRSVSRSFEGSLLSYDLHIADFLLPPESTLCGHSLQQSGIRQSSGVSVVRIVRGGIHINIPGGRSILYPGDKIVVAGTDEQIQRFHRLLDTSQRTPSDRQSATRTHVTLEQFVVGPSSPLVGTSLMQSGIREQAQCVVMGIERDGSLLANPDPQLTFRTGDLVVVAGETERIRQFVRSNSGDDKEESSEG